MDQNQNSFPSYSSTPPQNPIQTNPSLDTMSPINKPKKVGPIVAILVVILIIIIAGVYFVSKQFEVVSPDTDTALNPVDETSDLSQINNTNTSVISETIAPITNTSDDLDSLQKDLNSSIDGLDAQQI